MTVSRRLARAGLGVFALTAGALAVALVSNPQWLREGRAGKPEAHGHRAGAQQAAAVPAGALSAHLAPPPLPITAGDAPGPASRDGAEARPSSSSGGAPSVASMAGFTPGTGLLLGSAAPDAVEANLDSLDGEEPGAQGLRTQGRSLTFAAVSTHRLGGAGDLDLPDEPTSAGLAAVTTGAAGGTGWQAGGTGGVFGNAAVGSFASATGSSTGAGAEGRTAQVPARSAAVSLGPVALASAVPEPAPAAMLLAGFVVLAAAARRQGDRALTAKS